MTIEITFVGFPTLYDFFHSDHLLHSFSGGTLKNLVESLSRQYGEVLNESLWDQSRNHLDPAIQVVINDQYVDRGDRDHLPISEGDRVKFLRLLAGG